MKKQQKTYALLIAVLVIWGLIGYQIYIRFTPSTPSIVTSDIQIRYKREHYVQQTNYELHTIYRDPFLGSFPKKKKVVKKKSVPKKPKPAVVFPEITYNGIIEGNGSKSYILTVNRRQEILKLNEEFLGITLLKASKSEIKVKFKNELKTIVKQ